MKKKKDYKLIREIKEIINSQDLHWWKKCKSLTLIETYGRPGSTKGEWMIIDFFKVCAGRFQNRFESAYVRPYVESWDDRTAYDYVNEKRLNKERSVKIGRNPRGIELISNIGCSQRFDNYLKRKYPEAFEKFEEIKKVEHTYCTEMRRTEDRAWQHIFYAALNRNYYGKQCRGRDWLKTTKDTQKERRKLDLAMEKAAEDYKKLKKASKLPPRYLYRGVSLAKLQDDHKNQTYTIVKSHYITTETVLHYDNSDVSFGLGHLKRTDRKILIRNGKGIVFSKDLKSYAGHFVLNTIEEYFGKVKKVKAAPELKPVQMNPKMELLELSPKHGFRIFQRLFSHSHYDYCVLKDSLTYHSSSVEMCKMGWKKKAALTAKKTGNKIYNWKICRSLGFCRSELISFCIDNKIDRHGSYTVEELKEIVSKRLSHNKIYYGRELAQIGVL